jgi:hypothetical protein
MPESRIARPCSSCATESKAPPEDDGLWAQITQTVDLLAGAEVVTAAATTDECLCRRFRPVDVVITPW